MWNRKKRLAELERQQEVSDEYKRQLWASDVAMTFEDGVLINFKDGSAQFFFEDMPMTTELTFAKSEKLMSALSMLHKGTVKPHLPPANES